MHPRASRHALSKRFRQCQSRVHLSSSSNAQRALQATYLDDHCKVVEIFTLLLMAISTTVIDVLEVAALNSMILFTSFQRLKSMRLGIGFNKHISGYQNNGVPWSLMKQLINVRHHMMLLMATNRRSLWNALATLGSWRLSVAMTFLFFYQY